MWARSQCMYLQCCRMKAFGSISTFRNLVVNLKRLAFLANYQMSLEPSMNFLQAQDRYNGENERLCSLSELWGYWSKEPLQQDAQPQLGQIKTAIHVGSFIMVCAFPQPSEDDLQSMATLKRSAWGSENQILPFLPLPKVQTARVHK